VAATVPVIVAFQFVAVLELSTHSQAEGIPLRALRTGARRRITYAILQAPLQVLEAGMTSSQKTSLAQGATAYARRPGIPGLLVALLFVVAALLPLLAALVTGTEPAGIASEFATAFGLTAAALLFLQFLSSGRYESISGRIGIDRTMGFHRIAAYVLLAFALLHPLSYLAGTLLTDPVAAWHRLSGMLGGPRLRSGVVALAVIIVIVALATLRTLPFMRYEYWRAAHGPLAILAAGLVLHHTMSVGAYSAEGPVRLVWGLLASVAAGAIALVYVVRPCRMWREDWRVENVQRLGERLVEMVLRGPATTKLRFRPGQFIWMTLAPNRPPFHDHPFSIASAPAALPRLRLVIGEVGDCTRAFAEVAPGTRVAIDGPHGSFIVPPVKAPVFLIGGGAGIAPLLGMLEQAAADGDGRPYRLLYAARKQSGLVYLGHLRALQSQLDLSIHILVDEGPRDKDCALGPLRANRISDALGAADPQGAVALICGPPRMMEIAADALFDAGFPRGSVLYERFDYGAGKGRLDRQRQRHASLVFLVLLAAITAFTLR
jgi:predicted ferric reductase